MASMTLTAATKPRAGGLQAHRRRGKYQERKVFIWWTAWGSNALRRDALGETDHRYAVHERRVAENFFYSVETTSLRQRILRPAEKEIVRKGCAVRSA